MIDYALCYACAGLFVIGWGDLAVAFRIADWFSSLTPVICVGLCEFV